MTVVWSYPIFVGSAYMYAMQTALALACRTLQHKHHSNDSRAINCITGCEAQMQVLSNARLAQGVLLERTRLEAMEHLLAR